MAIRPALKAVLFDLDGTIALTDELHLSAYNEVLAPFGLTIDVDCYRTKVMGRANRAIMEDLLPDRSEAVWDQVSSAKEAAFRAKVGCLTPNRGFLDLLAWIEARGWRVAVVTNAPRENATMMLQGLGLERRLGTVVIGDELSHGKPHPLPYLTGLSLLGAAPTEAIAFEDSLSGVRSASGAGIRTYGMMTALSADELIQAGAVDAIGDFADEKLWRYLEA
jgi:beta-phosphoglucomutase-like phosphatase (HAD superfamily)